jgi:hypothetical protein
MSLTVRELHALHKDGKEILLPSGLSVRLRPVSVSTFIHAGMIPDQLTPLVARIVSGQRVMLTPEEQLSQLDILDAFVKTCIVWPRIVDTPTDLDNEISTAMLDEDDKAFIFNFLGMPASTLASFRREEEEPVDGVLRGESVGRQSEQPAEPEGVGERPDRDGGHLDADAV